MSPVRTKNCANPNCDRTHTRSGPRCGRCASYWYRHNEEHPGVDLLLGAEPCPEGCTCGRHGYYGNGDKGKCESGCTCGRHTAPGRPRSHPDEYYTPEAKAVRVAGYKEAKRFRLPKKCQINGCTHPATERHHIDGDPTNNSKNNLVGLCMSCHKSVHTKGGEAHE